MKFEIVKYTLRDSQFRYLKTNSFNAKKSFLLRLICTLTHNKILLIKLDVSSSFFVTKWHNIWGKESEKGCPGKDLFYQPDVL